jgi:hypothetical protein
LKNAISRDEVIAARRKYESLKNTFEEQQVSPQVFPVFPSGSGGDPKIEVFNLMSRTLEERTALILQAEQVGERRAAGRRNG